MKAREAIRDLALACQEKPTWPRPIPVTERLPTVEERKQGLLAFVHSPTDPPSCWAMADFNDGKFSWGFDEMPGEVTHWLPLPAAPEVH